jgi:5-methylcytosine-specific restriction endonuclease McrA
MRKKRMKLAGELPPAELIMLKFAYYGDRCIYCSTPGKMTIEHKKPISRGGLNLLANLAPACHRCNRIKNNKTVKEFKIC